MLRAEFTVQFKKDCKITVKRRCDPIELQKIIMLLCNEQLIPEKYRDHALVDPEITRI